MKIRLIQLKSTIFLLADYVAIYNKNRYGTQTFIIVNILIVIQTEKGKYCGRQMGAGCCISKVA